MTLVPEHFENLSQEAEPAPRPAFKTNSGRARQSCFDGIDEQEVNTRLLIASNVEASLSKVRDQAL